MAGLNRSKVLQKKTYFKRLFVHIFGMIIMLCMVAISWGVETQKDDDMKTLFEKKYKTWKEEMNKPSPSSVRPVGTEADREIIKLGIPALPYMMDKMEEGGTGRFLSSLVLKITKKKFHISWTGKKTSQLRWSIEEFPDRKDLTSPTAKYNWPPAQHKLYLLWWKEGKKHTDQYFEKLYDEWKELKRQNKTEEAKEKYQRIIDLGIAALPNIMQKAEQGDSELTKAISKLTDGKVEKNAKQSECSNWWKENKEKWLIPFPKPAEEPNEPTPK